jgi:hypothetical protein
MVDIARVRLSRRAASPERRRRRLERELQALGLMSQRLWLIELGWAIVIVPFLAVLCVMILAAQGWPARSLLPLITVMLAICALVWWIGSRWWLPVQVFIWVAWLSIMILAETLTEPPLGLSDKKEARRAKVDRAIAKREAMLRALQEGRSTS